MNVQFARKGCPSRVGPDPSPCAATGTLPVRMSQTFRELISSRIESGGLKPDPAQMAAADQLDMLKRRVMRSKQGSRSFKSIFRKSKEGAEKGLYIWGKVGRGKSMLMDLFFESAGTGSKRRVHFLDFMQEVHAALHDVRKTEVDDAIPPVAKQLAENARVICLDEMQVEDIADAMIVGRLFEGLNRLGSIVCTTSNFHPSDLYKDGLNRHLFLPFVDFVGRTMVVHELAGGIDYRQDRLQGAPTYFTPADSKAAEAIDGIWRDLTGGHSENRVLHYKGRQIHLPRYGNGVARSSFWELCGQPLGPGDFLAIANAVRVLIVEDVPSLARSNYNEAKRFVLLVDALYEARVQLIVSAAAEPENLYSEGSGAFQFERAASRIREMQSSGWQLGSASETE